MPAWDGNTQIAAGGRPYQAVAANTASANLGAKGGAAGDTIDYVWIFPTTTTPGNVVISDGATAIWTMSGVTLSSTQPIPVPLNLRSQNNPGGWKISTGANVSVLAVGLFT